MPTLLAQNADVLVAMDDEHLEFPNTALFAREGIIEQLGSSEELPQDADVVLDHRGERVWTSESPFRPTRQPGA
ncbi:MAG: hypothetical protein JOZ19_00160 [Rubrobacter sp.]|nr:hypothetical protein [Rubrobacter sp.]